MQKHGLIKYLKQVVFFTIVFAAATTLFSQKTSNIWYFGRYAGLDFNTTPPTALSSPMNTVEGCATLSDDNGNLLFYTDGENVWNNNHDTMPNGSGLLGNSSSVQSSIIIPFPGTTNLKYIFTADWSPGTNGLRYSVVDLNLDGGKGDIVAGMKNVQLIAPVTERLTAVLHCNGQDIWVIIKNSINGFHAFKITPDGVDTTPIISNVGDINQIWGSLRSSPDGKRLVATQTGAFEGAAELYDFDNATGEVSNPLLLESNSIYSAEFSPSGDLLYVSHIFTGSPDIFQYDLTAANIPASRVRVARIVSVPEITSSARIATLQLAPDGKIYIAKPEINFLSIISEPDSLGLACNVLKDAIALETGTKSRYGLPQTVIESKPLSTTITPIGPFCKNDAPINLTASNPEGIWSGLGVVDNVLGVFDPFNAGVGTHKITYMVSGVCGGATDTIEVIVNDVPEVVFEITPDTVMTTNPEVYFEDFSEVDSIISRSWNFGGFGTSVDENPSYLFPEEQGCYEVQLSITNSKGCTSSTVKKIVVKERSAVFIPNTITPNRDGLNDSFSPQGVGVQEEGYRFSVFNRWGEKIYETDQLGDKWDGKYKGESVKEGEYIYKLTFKEEEGKERTRTGKVTLIR